MIGLDRDHSTICKFHSSDDGEFKLVIGHLLNMAQEATRDAGYSLIYDETNNVFSRGQTELISGITLRPVLCAFTNRVLGRHCDYDLSLAESVEVGQRILNTCQEDNLHLSEIDVNIDAMRSKTTYNALQIVAIVVGMATAISLASLSGIGIFAIPALCTTLFASLRPLLATTSRTTQRSMEWSQLSIEVLVEKQFEIEQAVHIIQKAEVEDTTSSVKLREESGAIRCNLERELLSICQEQHMRGLQGIRFRRQAEHARHAEEVNSKAENPSNLGSALREMLQGVLLAVLSLIGIIFAGLSELLSSLEYAVKRIVNSVWD
jgi:hypothetical protein